MLTTEKRPQLKPLKEGEEFKIYEVTGETGCVMPSHISTKEATVIIQTGSAVLDMEDEQYKLAKGDVVVIPGGKVHALSIQEDFKAIIVMGLDSNIQFK